MKKLKSLTIFFPAYNDEKSIGSLVREAFLVGKRVSQSLEIIVVNDGSTDNTERVLNKLVKKLPLRVITHKKNCGYGAALRSGFKNSKKDWVFYTDGDGQYDVGELRKLVDKVRNGVDVVNGFKKRRSDKLSREILGKIYNSFLQVLYRPPIRDIDCDFRLIRRKKLKGLSFKTNSGAFPLELVLGLKKNGSVFREIAVTHKPRRHGQSQFFQKKHLYQTLLEHLYFSLDR